jgi:hypothetical protein
MGKLNGNARLKSRKLDDMQKKKERNKDTNVPKSGGARYFSPHEVISLLRECDKWSRDVVLFALSTGVRRGDILSLKWSQVDLKHRELMISNLYALPLNGTAMNILKAKLDNADKAGFVFLADNGEMINYHYIVRALRSSSSKAGIDMIRLHDLRHTLAANLFKAGVDCYIVGGLLGHKTAGTPVRHLRSIPKLLRRAIEALDKKNLYGTAEYCVTLLVLVGSAAERDAVKDKLNKINEVWDSVGNGGSSHPEWVVKTKKDALELDNKLKEEFKDFPGTLWYVTNGVGGERMPYKELIDFDE